MRRRIVVIILAAALIGIGAGLYTFWPVVEAHLFGRGAIQTAPPPVRPTAWATPLDRPGLPNLHRITDGLYRGAQPTEEGMRQLQAMGVKTVVNLRTAHSDKGLLGEANLHYIEIPTEPWRIREDEVVKFLQSVTDGNLAPVFFHCQHGADRTGTMAAVYRIVVQGWSKEEAIAEMTRGGFGFHTTWRNLVEYVNALDVNKLRRN